MAEEKDTTKQIDAIVGPYAGKRLSVTAADFEGAINDHWAVDPFAEPDDEPHPPLSDEERTHAVEAANTWAAAQTGDVPPPEPPEPPPEEGGTRRRAMTPENSAPGYAVRQVDRPAPQRKP